MHRVSALCVIFVWFCCISTKVQAQTVPKTRSACVSEFWTKPDKFAMCRTQLCFIFKFDQPFVFDNEKLEKESSHPFLCRDRERLYPGLRGLFFNVLDRVSLREDVNAKPRVRDAYCIYSGGDSCSYDGQIRFLDDTVRAGGGHMFIAGGYLNFMPNRRMESTVQAAQTVTDSVVLMHLRNPATRSFRAAVKNVFEPFEASGWAVGLTFAAVVGATVFVYAQLFYNRANNQPHVLVWLLNGVPGVPADQQAAWRLLVLTMVVFGTVIAILYELAIALALFRGPEPIVTSVTQLFQLGLGNFVVTKGGASETILHFLIDRQGIYNESSYPWKRMNRMEPMIEALLNRKVRYIFMFEQNIKFWLNRRKLCDVVAVTPLHHPTAGGWYYSTSVPVAVRTRIDKILQFLWVMQDGINGDERFKGVPLDCGASFTKVNHSVLFILLMLTVLPLLIASIIAMVKAKFTLPGNQAQVEEEEDSETERDSSAKQ